MAWLGFGEGSAAAEGFPSSKKCFLSAQLRHPQQPEKLQPPPAGDRAVVYADGAGTWFPVSVEIARLFADSLNAPVE